jgi:hypothetical protein
MKVNLNILVVFAFCACSINHSRVITGDEGKPLPNIQILLMDSATKYDLDKNDFEHPTVLFLFSPYCPYCRAETAEIVNYSKSNSKIHFIFLSNFPYTSIKDFYLEYHLSTFPNIIFGQDYSNYFGTHYKIPGFPYMAIYNQNKKIKQVLLGQTSLQTIQEIASE